MRIAGALWAIAMLGPLDATAQGKRADVTGSLRAGHWSSTRQVDDVRPIAAGMAWLKASAVIRSELSLRLEGWAALEGPADDTRGTGEIREGYLAAAFGPLDVKLGRQVIAWGRADGVNPTGNLAAEDFTLLAPDDADRRLGTAAAVASYYVGDVSFTGVWMPEFRGHRVPLPGGGSVSITRESPEWPATQWGIRVERTGGRLDWSASFYDGIDLAPDLSPGDVPGSVVLLHHGHRVIGADAATTIGRIGFRAEAAFTLTDDDQGTDAFVKNPYAFLVFGGDQTFGGRLNLNIQYLLRHVSRFGPPTDPLSTQQAVFSSQARRTQHGGSIRASFKWLHETLETELAGVAYVDPRGAAVRPKVTYAVNDHVNMIVGGEILRGHEDSAFKMLRRNSLGFAELRWSF